MLIYRLCADKRKRDPHTGSVKASRMKANQGKDLKLIWEGGTKCLKLRESPGMDRRSVKGKLQ